MIFSIIYCIKTDLDDYDQCYRRQHIKNGVHIQNTLTRLLKKIEYPCTKFVILCFLFFAAIGKRHALCPRVLDAETSTKGKEVVIFGTLYKEMKKKKSVLDEYHDVCSVVFYCLFFYAVAFCGICYFVIFIYYCDYYCFSFFVCDLHQK